MTFGWLKVAVARFQPYLCFNNLNLSCKVSLNLFLDMEVRIFYNHAMKPKDLMQRHNDKLQKLGIPYQAQTYPGGSNPKSLYVCEKGHKFEADRSRLVRGVSKCPTCNPGQGRNMTHEGYELRLMEMESALYPLEPYRGIHTKILHGCAEGHEHVTLPASVLSGINCPVCSGMVKKTTASYSQELLDKGIEYLIVDDYVNVMVKINHQCPTCDLVWSVKPHDILHGTGCPACASFGFNRGKPAILYYVKLWDEYKTYYKVGITNKTVEQRFRNCGKQYKVLLEKSYEMGREAEAAEQMILEEYASERAIAPRWLRSGGSTELFKSDILLLDLNSSVVIQ